MSQEFTKNSVQVGKLWLQINPYGGCYLGPRELSACSPEDFAVWCQQQLDSLSYPLCWLELTETLMPFIPAALAAGFTFHHCQKRQLMMVKKLQASAYLPFAATHSIGIGGATFNDRGEILLIRERPLPSQLAASGSTGTATAGTAMPTHWKLPGGMVEPFENFTDAVVREVFEETGVTATFSQMLALRHHHHGQFGASNIYFVALLQATSAQIAIDEREIAEARWFEPMAFLQDPTAGAYNKLLVQLALKAYQHDSMDPALAPTGTPAIATAGVGWHSHKIPGYRAADDTYEVFSPRFVGRSE